MSDNDKNDEKGRLIVPESRDWLKDTTIEDIVNKCPEKIDLVLNALNLEFSDLSRVKKARESDNKKKACQALLDYYENDNNCQWLLELLPEPNSNHVKIAEEIVNGKVCKGNSGSIGKVPERNGAWDGWLFFYVRQAGL